MQSVFYRKRLVILEVRIIFFRPKRADQKRVLVNDATKILIPVEARFK